MHQHVPVHSTSVTRMLQTSSPKRLRVQQVVMRRHTAQDHRHGTSGLQTIRTARQSQAPVSSFKGTGQEYVAPCFCLHMQALHDVCTAGRNGICLRKRTVVSIEFWPYISPREQKSGTLYDRSVKSVMETDTRKGVCGNFSSPNI